MILTFKLMKVAKATDLIPAYWLPIWANIITLDLYNLTLLLLELWEAGIRSVKLWFVHNLPTSRVNLLARPLLLSNKTLLLTCSRWVCFIWASRQCLDIPFSFSLVQIRPTDRLSESLIPTHTPLATTPHSTHQTDSPPLPTIASSCQNSSPKNIQISLVRTSNFV